MAEKSEYLEKVLSKIDEIKNADYLKLDGQKLQELLNMDPPTEWVEKHPTATKEIINPSGKLVKVPVLYLPIEKVEFLLRNIFPVHDIEITNQNAWFNGAVVSVRIHYLDPVTNKMRFFDGIGSDRLKNGVNALSIIFPLAKSLAIKDACDHFGKLFGADLNRKKINDFALSSALNNDQKKAKIKALLDTPGIMISEDQRIFAERIVKHSKVKSYDKAIRILSEKLPKKKE